MDITMCCAKNCIYTNQCYRYRKEPNYNQEYYDFTYECIMSSNYDMFIATVSENTEEQIRNYIKSQKEK